MVHLPGQDHGVPPSFGSGSVGWGSHPLLPVMWYWVVWVWVRSSWPESTIPTHANRADPIQTQRATTTGELSVVCCPRLCSCWYIDQYHLSCTVIHSHCGSQVTVVVKRAHTRRAHSVVLVSCASDSWHSGGVNFIGAIIWKGWEGWEGEREELPPSPWEKDRTTFRREETVGFDCRCHWPFLVRSPNVKKTNCFVNSSTSRKLISMRRWSARSSSPSMEWTMCGLQVAGAVFDRMSGGVATFCVVEDDLIKCCP